MPWVTLAGISVLKVLPPTRCKEKKPEQWSSQARNWEPIGTLLVNPDREQQVEKIAA